MLKWLRQLSCVDLRICQAKGMMGAQSGDRQKRNGMKVHLVSQKVLGEVRKTEIRSSIRYWENRMPVQRVSQVVSTTSHVIIGAHLTGKRKMEGRATKEEGRSSNNGSETC
jgi:hypothetical protein